MPVKKHIPCRISWNTEGKPARHLCSKTAEPLFWPPKLRLTPTAPSEPRSSDIVPAQKKNAVRWANVWGQISECTVIDVQVTKTRCQRIAWRWYFCLTLPAHFNVVFELTSVSLRLQKTRDRSTQHTPSIKAEHEHIRLMLVSESCFTKNCDLGLSNT